MSRTKYKYIIYFLNILASGFFYSFITTELLKSNIQNQLLIIIISSIVNLILFFDIKKLKIFDMLPIHYYTIFGLIVGIILLIYILLSRTNIYFYLLAYFFISLIIAIVTIVFENTILKDEITLNNGFLNMQILRTIAKLIGFLLGNILSFYSSIVFLIFFIILLILNTYFTWNFKINKKDQLEKRTENIKGKQFFLILGVLSTTTTIWIPILTKDFLYQGKDNLSWIPFVLPGILTILFLEFQKKYLKTQNNIYLEILYTSFSIVFLIMRLNSDYIILQTFIFSFITSISISLGIKLRKIFLEINNQNSTKYILQSLYVSSSVFSLVFSLFGNYITILQIIIIACNILSMFYLIIKKGDFI